MMISSGFDMANQNRKKEQKRRAIKTAQRLRDRVRQFVNDCQKNDCLTDADVAHLINEIRSGSQITF